MRVTSLGLLALAAFYLQLGCGDSKEVQSAHAEPTATAREQLIVSSPVVQAGKRVPPSFPCRSDEVWVPLKIDGVPERAAELILVTSRSESHRGEGGAEARVVSTNLLAGIGPKVNRLKVGAAPAGTFWRQQRSSPPTGTWPRLYYTTICPGRAGIGGFTFTVYAMTNRYSLGLRDITYLKPSELEELDDAAVASGSLGVLYHSRFSRR